MPVVAPIRTSRVYACLPAGNALVGGASTSAAMAMEIRRPDLALKGTILGTAGYLIGTPVGLWAAAKIAIAITTR
jgi:uncharacterized membrane protein